jgi:hypothetical protein
MGAMMGDRHQLRLESLSNFHRVTNGDGLCIEEAVFKSIPSMERPSPTVTTVTTRTIGGFWRWWKSSPDYVPYRIVPNRVEVRLQQLLSVMEARP